MSFRTTYEMLGLDYENEKILRKIENEENIDEEVFYPRMTNYTYSNKGEEDYKYEEKGRNEKEDADPDKREEDRDRNKAKDKV